jgi:hypothetical protein
VKFILSALLLVFSTLSHAHEAYVRRVFPNPQVGALIAPNSDGIPNLSWPPSDQMYDTFKASVQTQIQKEFPEFDNKWGTTASAGARRARC